MNAKLLITILACAVLTALVVWVKRPRHEELQNSEQGEAPRTATAVASAASVPAEARPAGAPLPLPSPSAPPSDRAFQNFVSQEAKQVDATHVDGARTSKELADVIARLTPAQARQLLQTALNPASTAGERILSAYMMVEAWPRAAQELQQLITAPLSYASTQPAHSEGELRAMQERSVRVMALEGLLSHAAGEPAAREALAKTIPDIPDPYIKNYAEKRSAEIGAH